jgi:hypothetical protein
MATATKAMISTPLNVMAGMSELPRLRDAHVPMVMRLTVPVPRENPEVIAPVVAGLAVGAAIRRSRGRLPPLTTRVQP